jgi:hypothetical protein
MLRYSLFCQGLRCDTPKEVGSLFAFFLPLGGSAALDTKLANLATSTIHVTVVHGLPATISRTHRHRLSAVARKFSSPPGDRSCFIAFERHTLKETRATISREQGVWQCRAVGAEDQRPDVGDVPRQARHRFAALQVPQPDRGVAAAPGQAWPSGWKAAAKTASVCPRSEAGGPRLVELRGAEEGQDLWPGGWYTHLLAPVAMERTSRVNRFAARGGC